MKFIHSTKHWWRLWRRGQSRFYGVYFIYANRDDGSEFLPWYKRLVWPWRFGWGHTQMHEPLFFGPGYFLWGM